MYIALEQPNGYRYILQGKWDYTIGRSSVHEEPPDADLSDAYGFEAGVSRRHVMIHVRDNGIFLEDLDSLNETVHNGFRLAPGQWYSLRSGDEIRLGAIILNIIFRPD